MAAKTEMIRARVTPELKREADAPVSRGLGLSATDAITVFYRQAVLRQGLPFEVRIPNAETRRAIAETKSGEGLVDCPGGVDELMAGLE